MKIKHLIKPAGLGIAAIAITNYIAPKYTEIAAVGTGLYVLYNIVSYKEPTPHATNIRYDKATNKVVADIKNPSDETFAFLHQIRLIEAMKPMATAEGMEPAMATTMQGRSTLIGETDMPIVIGPKEIVSVECPLMIPQEMYESTDGSLNIRLSFHDVQTAIEEITRRKTEQKICQIEQKIEPIVSIPEPTLVQPETIEPKLEELIDPKNELSIDETTISIVPENIHKIEKILENFKEEDLYTDSLKSLSIPTTNRSGRFIGSSQSMLEIIRSIERLKAMNSRLEASLNKPLPNTTVMIDPFAPDPSAPKRDSNGRFVKKTAIDTAIDDSDAI